jgi:hypothetical protein
MKVRLTKADRLWNAFSPFSSNTPLR